MSRAERIDHVIEQSAGVRSALDDVTARLDKFVRELQQLADASDDQEQDGP